MNSKAGITLDTSMTGGETLWQGGGVNNPKNLADGICQWPQKGLARSGSASDSNLWNLRYRVREWGGRRLLSTTGSSLYAYVAGVCQTPCQNRLTCAPDLSSQYKICELPWGHGLCKCGYISEVNPKGNPIWTQNTPSDPSRGNVQKVQNKGDGRTRHANVQQGGNWQQTISRSILIQLCFGCYRTTSEGGTYYSYSNNDGMNAWTKVHGPVQSLPDLKIGKLGVRAMCSSLETPLFSS